MTTLKRNLRYIKGDFIVSGPLWPARASRWSSPNV